MYVLFIYLQIQHTGVYKYASFFASTITHLIPSWLGYKLTILQ